MGDSLFIVTGASRGIGKAISHALASSNVLMKGQIHFALTSTKLADLQAAQEALTEVFSASHGSSSNLHVHLTPVEMNDIPSLPANLSALLTVSGVSKWAHVVLIMNHGSLGGLKSIEDVGSDIVQLQTAINVNITSCILLASAVLKAFIGKSDRLDVVNVSSLAAIKAFETWGVYCIGKAARDMLIQVIAVEVETTKAASNGTIVKSLNYAPGPVDTDMQAEIRQTATVEEQRAFYTSMFEAGKLVTPSQTSAKLVSILERNEYQSGAHIDFYDA